MQLAAILNLKRRKIPGPEPVLQAIPGKARFRSPLVFLQVCFQRQPEQAGETATATPAMGLLPPMAPASCDGQDRVRFHARWSRLVADDRAGGLAGTPQHGDAGVTPYKAWDLDSPAVVSYPCTGI